MSVLHAAYSAAVNATLAHEARHAPAWKIPCRTCRELLAIERAALAALVGTKR